MRTRNWIFTSLTILVLLFYHSLLKLYYTHQIIGPSSLGFPGLSSKNIEGNDGFAYVFYATADLYACSTLVNIHRLRALNSTIPIHVLASEYLSVPYMDALQGADVTVHVEETPYARYLAGGYYEDCLLKMLAFKMHKLDPSLKRVLIFDSDQLVLKHFDNLFTDLPRVDLAAPRAYWLPPAGAPFSSAFMMITLSDRLWDKVNQSLPIDEWPPAPPKGADMTILNDEFQDTAMILSGEYVTLNSHWEDWGLPNWFHPEDSPSLNRSITQVVPNIAELSRYFPKATTFPSWKFPGSEICSFESSRGYPYGLYLATPVSFPLRQILTLVVVVDKPPVEPLTDLKPRDTSQGPVNARRQPTTRFPESSEIFQQLIQLHEYASIIHFTALGKPWKYSAQDVMWERPDAHPLFAFHFGMWRKVASEVCPEDWRA